MRVNNSAAWMRALDANDPQYGVANLAICDQQVLLAYLKKYYYQLPEGVNEVFGEIADYDPYDQLQLTIRFYQCYPKYYMDHVVRLGVLETPPGMGKGLFTTEEVIKKLAGAPPANVGEKGFFVGESGEGPWGKAIAMLREKIGLEPEGDFDLNAAKKLYQYGAGRWRFGRGYLYSDSNPEMLFEQSYEEYITAVNSEVWTLAGLKTYYLEKNDHETWTIPRPDPSTVMFDMSGRTVGQDEFQKNPVAVIGRTGIAYFNAVIQNCADHDASEEWRNIEEDMPAHIFFLGELQRGIWAMGAEVGYALGWELTWYLLTHSLSGYPDDVVIEEGVSPLFDKFVNKFRDSTYVKEKIEEFLKNKTDSFPQEQTSGLLLQESGIIDLFAAINKCELWIAGEKNADGSWDLEIELKDEYDFTDFENPFAQDSWEGFFGWAANDVAFASQKFGAITPYHVTIRYKMNGFVVE